MPDSEDVVRAEAVVSMRYEDVCQDGRLMTMGMPHALGSLWKETLQSMPVWDARKMGVIPILAQMWIRGTDERVHVGKRARSEGEALLAHTVDKDGSVGRILLDMRARIFATRGSVLGSEIEGAGDEVLAGEVFARHVFTKLFANPGERRVHKLNIPGVPEVPEHRVPWIDSDNMLPKPTECEWLDDSPTPWSYEPLFGPQHCDSNQHVNSLMYPRLFEDAAQQRFDEHHRGSKMLSRAVALDFRRPFFAGQRTQIQLRAFGSDDTLGAEGAFMGPGGKTHCNVSMRFG